MSVINKMLRDLDQRQTPGAGTTDPLRRATASVVSVPPLPRRSSPAMRWVIVLLPLAAAATGGWVWWNAPLVVEPVVAVPAAVVAPAAPAATPAVSAPEVLAVAAQEAASAPVAAVSAIAPPAMSEPPVVVLAPPMPAPAPAPAARNTAPANVGLRMETKLANPTPVPASQAQVAKPATEAGVGVPAKPMASVVDASAAARQQQAGRDTLAQAQNLWASGARDTAISTLQEAVAVAERNPQSGGAATLVPLLRELARMQLAEGQAAAAWDVLARHEALMNNQPELWALRANAAQRLGRHQDSVQAYTNALQSRPAEQRWLLGTAVSLAALGQTTAAAEMAERARSVGPVSRDVLAYLRQQGVPLTDRP